MKTIQIASLIYLSFLAFPMNADTLIIEPVMVDIEGTNVDIYEVRNISSGELIGEQITYNYGDGNTYTEITINKEEN